MNETGIEAGSGPESRGVVVETDLGCVSCGYNLRGLRSGGVCPECGTALEKSMRGDLLEYAGEDYVRKLYSGSKLVVGGILAYVLVGIVGIVVGAVGIGGSLSPGVLRAIELGMNLLGMCASVCIALGWWWLSEPNPASIDPSAGSASRQFVRVTSALSVCSAVIQTIVVMLWSTQLTTPGGTQVALTGVMLAISLGGMVVFAIAFFSQMAYVKWIAPKLPNPWVHKRAMLMMWLGPLLSTVGVLCIGLGPLVALVLYYNLVTRVRADLKGILGRMEAAA